jgi:hypothetical protein
VRRLIRYLLPGLLAIGMAASALPAGADHNADLHSRNMRLLSAVPREGTFTQSDLAFDGTLAYAGNYNGFRVIDISDPEAPVVVSSLHCNGSQGDVSVYGDLLFSSVDTPQTSVDPAWPDTCAGSTNTTNANPTAWEGVRIFDVSDPANPQFVKAVPTDCGSHTHTLMPDGDTVYVYISSYPLGAAAQGPNCQRAETGGGHGFVSIITVPLDDPASATVSKYFLDPATELAVYPFSGTTSFRACHDISVFVELELAAAACMSEAQLWDISDPLNPQFLWRFDDPVVNTFNIDLWHSAAFSWDGSVVAFGDESGGGGAARCTNPNDQQGRVWFLDTETGAFLDNYKIPRSMPDICTMHNFNFIPLRNGRKVLVASAYTGGTTVLDVDALLGGATEADAEVGYYAPSDGSSWSSYWYNGFIIANDHDRGVDIFLLSDRARAGARKLPMMNPQTQVSVIA